MSFHLLRLIGLGSLLRLAAACQPAAVEDHEASHDRSKEILQRLVMTEAQPATAIRIASLVAEAYVPEDGQWQIGPSALTRLESWEVRIGETVDVGSPLARLVNYDSSDLDAQVREARAQVTQRQSVLQSRLDAQSHGVATAADVEEARAALIEAEARLHATQRSLRARSSGQATRDGLWRSPVQGVVAAIRCAPGALTQADATCLDILDTQRIALRVHVPEKISQQLPESVTATWIPWGKDTGDEGWTIIRRAPRIDALSRTQAIDFHKEGATLLTGQSGRLDLFVDAESHWLDIPSSALTTLDGHDVVFVPQDAQTLPAALNVQIIARTKDRIVIESSDLQAGDALVEQGVFLLRSLAIAELGGGHGH